MDPGDDILRSITEGIRATDKMILFCSEDSLTSWWVDDEVNKVLAKERAFHTQGNPEIQLVIPVDLDGALFEQGICAHPWADTLKRRIVERVENWDEPHQFETAAGRVTNALRTRPLKPLLPPPKLDPDL